MFYKVDKNIWFKLKKEVIVFKVIFLFKTFVVVSSSTAPSVAFSNR